MSIIHTVAAVGDLLPTEDFTISITWGHVDGTIKPVYWEYRNSALGELIQAGIRDPEPNVQSWWDPDGSEIDSDLLPDALITMLREIGAF